MLGTSLGRYNIEEELGQGGMSVVYRGQDLELERVVAVKVLHQHLAKKSENRERLRREARAIARLRHPNILEVYDYAGQSSEQAYIVMEFVEGVNLRQFVQRHGAMPPEYAAMLAMELCQALEHAHAEGIIHRDLKPENVMISHQGKVKLMDFGIAHIFDADTMTQTGSLLGSPAHMAPEMIEGEQVDARADIFALGTILYYLVTTQLPFEGKSAPQVLKRVLEGMYKSPESHDARVGKEFSRIVQTCLARAPESRYEDAGQMHRALMAYLDRVNFEPPHDHGLATYLLDPLAGRQAFERQIGPRLLTLANRAIDRGDHALACTWLNRILAYDPHNQAVLARLRRMQRRSFTRNRLLPGLALLLLLTTLGGVGLWAWQGREARRAQLHALKEAQRARTESQQHAVRQASALAGTITTRLPGWMGELANGARMEGTKRGRGVNLTARDVALSSYLSDPRRTQPEPVILARVTRAPDLQAPQTSVAEPQAQAAETYRYKFKMLPPAATLVMDGRSYDAFEVLNQGVQVQEGKRYRVVASSRGCQTRVFSLVIRGPQVAPPKPIVLQWLDSDVPNPGQQSQHDLHQRQACGRARLAPSALSLHRALWPSSPQEPPAHGEADDPGARQGRSAERIQTEPDGAPRRTPQGQRQALTLGMLVWGWAGAVAAQDNAPSPPPPPPLAQQEEASAPPQVPLSPEEALLEAREAFRNIQFAKLRPLLEPILLPTPKLGSKEARLEARALLGTGLFFEAGSAQGGETGRLKGEASAQFLEVLREDPDFELDPLIYPSSVVDFFEDTRLEHREGA